MPYNGAYNTPNSHRTPLQSPSELRLLLNKNRKNKVSGRKGSFHLHTHPLAKRGAKLTINKSASFAGNEKEGKF
jgi:hypothetical protein